MNYTYKYNPNAVVNVEHRSGANENEKLIIFSKRGVAAYQNLIKRLADSDYKPFDLHMTNAETTVTIVPHFRDERTDYPLNDILYFTIIDKSNNHSRAAEDFGNLVRLLLQYDQYETHQTPLEKACDQFYADFIAGHSKEELTEGNAHLEQIVLSYPKHKTYGAASEDYLAKHPEAEHVITFAHNYHIYMQLYLSAYGMFPDVLL